MALRPNERSGMWPPHRRGCPSRTKVGGVVDAIDVGLIGDCGGTYGSLFPLTDTPACGGADYAETAGESKLLPDYIYYVHLQSGEIGHGKGGSIPLEREHEIPLHNITA
jgi:hypothetical protein